MLAQHITLIILQDTNQKLPNVAPESSFTFWFVTQVVVTLIVFIGVYYIMKPVFGKKKDE